MSFSEYATQLTTKAVSLNTENDSIGNIDLNASWTGDASNTQCKNKKDLLSSLNKQQLQLNRFAGVLNLIDEYDSEVSRLEKLELYIDDCCKQYGDGSDFTREERDACQYDENIAARNQCRENVASLKSRINKGIASIDVTYNTKYEEIPATDIISTNDAFETMFNGFGTALNSTFSFKTGFKNSIPDNLRQPNFHNLDAWVRKNPFYSQNCGQCTWFACGRFIELYGFDPNFHGNGRECAPNLIAAHPDMFEAGDIPVAGAVFSQGHKIGTHYGHVGIVVEVDVEHDRIVIQDGNYNGHNDDFGTAQSDWGEREFKLSDLQTRVDVWANPKPGVYPGQYYNV